MQQVAAQNTSTTDTGAGTSPGSDRDVAADEGSIMDYKRSAGLGALAGVALDGTQYVRAYAKYGKMLTDQIEKDCYTLGQTGTLPPLTPPPPPLTRPPRNLFLIAAAGALSTGAIFGLLTLEVMIIGTALTDGYTAQGVTVGIFFGITIGLLTTFIPGILVAVLVQRREAGKQHASRGQAVLMQFHHEREALRHQVNEGYLSPHDAAARLGAMPPED